MRKMATKYGVLNIVEHIITKNFWEFYVTDDKYTDDIVRCMVMGDETELGDVSLSEIEPYIISRTKILDDIMPANKSVWVS